MKSALLLVLLAAPALAQDPPPLANYDGFDVSATIGVSASMSSSVDTALAAPIARLSVSAPLAFGAYMPDRLPTLRVDAELGSLPGTVIDTAPGIAGTIAQFRSLDFSIGASYRLSSWLPVSNGTYRVATSVYGEAGFATRLATNTTVPRDKSPRYGCAGLRFDEAVTSSLVKVGFCGDQRLTGDYQATATVTGVVTVFQLGDKGGVSIFVKAILGLDFSSPTHPTLNGGTSDAVSIGSLVGWR